MALARSKLADIQFISNSAASIYANPSSTKTFIRGLVFHNVNSAVQQVEVWNVPDSGGSLGTQANGNKFLDIALAPKETFIWETAYPIQLTDTNDAIFAKSASSSAVTVQILGDKE